MVELKSGVAKAKSGVRTQDPEGTRENIIEVATQEFAEYGLAGARIERSPPRQVQQADDLLLFRRQGGALSRVLEAAYSKVRAFEATLHLDDLKPVEALRRLVEFTFDHHNSNESFIRLVMIENIHHGEYLARSKAIQALNVTAIDSISRLYQRG